MLFITQNEINIKHNIRRVFSFGKTLWKLTLKNRDIIPLFFVEFIFNEKRVIKHNEMNLKYVKGKRNVVTSK